MAALMAGQDPALNGDQIEAALESPTVDPQVGTDRPAWMPLLGGYERDSQDSGVYPDLTPDGSRLAFISNRIANCTIDLVVRQTGVASCAVPSAAVAPFALTPDAQSVAYVTGNLVGNRDVHVQAIGGVDTDASVSSASVAANAGSSNPSISDDGRYVAFVTDASNLVSGDTNGVSDVFVRDTQSGTTTRVSVDSSGGQGNGASFNAEISGNGRYVVFVSSASNLVAGDSNGAADVFVHDLQTGATTRVDVTSGGAQTAFGVSTGNDEGPSIDATGRHVAFLTQAGDLVGGDAAGSPDIFVHDLQTGATTLESLSTQGIRIQAAHGPSLSANGRYLTFQATHDDYNGSASGSALVVRDLQTGITDYVAVDPGAAPPAPVSNDGELIAFAASDPFAAPGSVFPNDHPGVFVFDRSGTLVTGPAQLDGLTASIDVTPVVGAVAKVKPPHEVGTNLTFTFQWERCDVAGTLCNFIPNALGSTYRLTPADQGSRLAAFVTATNASGALSWERCPQRP